MSEEEIEYSYDLNFNKEDEYCIKHFGYNTFGDIEDLKLRQDKEHQIIQELQYRLEQRESQLDIANKKLEEIKEYITSYESISTIQGLENIKMNKYLDDKTMVEMTNRYFKVHDKILSIIGGE